MIRTPRIPRVRTSGRGAGSRPPRAWMIALVFLAAASPARQAPYRRLAQWQAGPEVREVHSLCFDLNGNLILVDSVASRVHRYSPHGHRLAEIGRGPGSGPGQFAGPRDCKVAGSGEIFISDGNNQRIQVFDQEGRFLRAFGSKGKGPGQLLRAHALDFGPDGNLYLVDVDNSRVIVFDPAGKFLSAWGKPGKGPGLFNAPHGLGFDAEGNLFVSNYYGPCQKYTARGKLLLEFAPAGFRGWAFFHAMATDSEGNVYLAARDESRKRNAVVMFDNRGRFLREWSPQEGRTVKTVAVDRQGRVYMAVDGKDFHGIEIFGP